jgi:hypothetical protein
MKGRKPRKDKKGRKDRKGRKPRKGRRIGRVGSLEKAGSPLLLILNRVGSLGRVGENPISCRSMCRVAEHSLSIAFFKPWPLLATTRCN